MKKICFVFILFFIYIQISAQVIKGKVVDIESKKLLEYASIGIISTNLGTITDENGNFYLDCKNMKSSAIVNISMIGYKSKSYTIKQLLDKDNFIELEVNPIKINTITITADRKSKKVGTTKYSIKGGLCGWGGSNFGRGHEIGLKIDLGNSYVKIQKIHIRVSKQSFDSSLFRLHIRDLKKSMPNNELLNENILISINESSGWVDFDLGRYNIFQKGEIALTLEWLSVFGLNKKRMIKVNDAKNKSANVLLNIKRKRGCMFMKKGVEAKWMKTCTQSPSIYLTVN